MKFELIGRAKEFIRSSLSLNIESLQKRIDCLESDNDHIISEIRCLTEEIINLQRVNATLIELLTGGGAGSKSFSAGKTPSKNNKKPN
jgi:prefoldin subunit 5